MKADRRSAAAARPGNGRCLVAHVHAADGAAPRAPRDFDAHLAGAGAATKKLVGQEKRND